MRKKNFNFNKGFTLIELLMFMGLFLILLIAFLQIFSSILDVQLESQATSSVEQDSRFILTRLTYDIQRAQNITTPASVGSHGSTLVLSMSGPATYTYSVNSGNLQLNDGTNTNNLNSFDTTVSNVDFKRLGNTLPNSKNSITIIFTLTSKTLRNGTPETRNFETTIGLR